MLLGHDYNNQPVFLSEHDLDRHGYLIGLTGTGKTTMLLNTASGAVSEKWGGLIVIDPHGDMSYDLLNMLPPSSVEKVILFDPVEQLDRPFGLNLFDIPDPKRIDVSADWAVTALKKAIASDTTWPMTADRVARHLFYALAPQGGTLLEVPRFLSDRAYRTKYYGYMAKHQATSFEYWHDYYDELGGHVRDLRITKEQAEEAGPMLRRLDRYLADERLRNILGQPRVTLNISEIMESGKVLIVRLPESELGAQAAGLLGSVILSHIFVAALGRSSQAREERKPVFVLIDEFDRFVAHEDVPRFFNEARKFNIKMLVAHQHRSQINSREIQDAVLGAGCLIAFQVLETDANQLGRQIGSKAETKLPTLDLYECYVKISGQAAHLLKTVPQPSSSQPGVADRIKAQSAQLGTPREQVDEAILQRRSQRYTIREEVKEIETRQSPI
jgi:hypothetical protein